MDGKTQLTLTILCIYCMSTVMTEEEQQPEIFLPPRNFNPHPYYQQYDGEYEAHRPTGNTGPVLFPGGEGVQQQQQQSHPIDLHPYAKVANKQKYKARGRYSNQDNQVNPNVYNALDAYAKKVLTTPTSALKQYVNPSLSDLKKTYKFSYKVLDHLTGDDFSHTQSQTPQATLGKYTVKLPDGRTQIVSYTADKSGYKAVVKYTEETPAPPQYHHSDGGSTYYPVTPKPAYYDDYGGESAYLGSKLVAPYVVEGQLFDEYGSEVYDPRQVVYRK